MLLALGFVGGALGSATAPRLARLIERRIAAPATVVQLAGALALAALAMAVWTPLAAGLFVLFYACNGAAAPLRDELMHEHVASDRRSTMVSAESLVFQGGAVVAALTMPALADAQGVPLAWLIGGAVLAAGACFYVGVPRRADTGSR